MLEQPDFDNLFFFQFLLPVKVYHPYFLAFFLSYFFRKRTEGWPTSFQIWSIISSASFLISPVRSVRSDAFLRELYVNYRLNKNFSNLTLTTAIVGWIDYLFFLVWALLFNYSMTPAYQIFSLFTEGLSVLYWETVICSRISGRSPRKIAISLPLQMSQVILGFSNNLIVFLLFYSVWNKGQSLKLNVMFKNWEGISAQPFMNNLCPEYASLCGLKFFSLFRVLVFIALCGLHQWLGYSPVRHSNISCM